MGFKVAQTESCQQCDLFWPKCLGLRVTANNACLRSERPKLISRNIKQIVMSRRRKPITCSQIGPGQ